MVTSMKKQAAYYLLLFILFSAPVISNAADLGEAETSVADARDEVGVAYQSVIDAEDAGADVSELVSRLNTAVDTLQQAERSLERGNYDDAVFYAGNTVQESRDTLEDAQSLTSRAAMSAEMAFRTQLVLSITATIYIIEFGYLTWFYFKRYYLRKMAEAKPGVVEVES